MLLAFWAVPGFGVVKLLRLHERLQPATYWTQTHGTTMVSLKADSIDSNNGLCGSLAVSGKTANLANMHANHNEAAGAEL